MATQVDISVAGAEETKELKYPVLETIVQFCAIECILNI